MSESLFQWATLGGPEMGTLETWYFSSLAWAAARNSSAYKMGLFLRMYVRPFVLHILAGPA